MVKRQFAGAEHHATVLAGVAVPQQDVLAGERPGLVGNAAVFKQPDHGRHTHGETRGMEKMPVLFFRHRQPLEHQNNGPPGGADVDGLVRSVKHQHRRLHEQILARRRRQLLRQLGVMALVSSPVPFLHGPDVPLY